MTRAQRNAVTQQVIEPQQSGMVRVEARMLTADGRLRPAAALELAEALMAERQVVITDAVLHLLAPHRAGAVRAEITRLRDGAEEGVAQIALIDESGAVLAQITQTWRAGAPPASIAASVPEARLAPLPGGATGTAEARRRRILEAASHVMAARGFANATTKEIAAAAGLHVPTMYQYVRSKDELLLLIFDDCLDKLAAGLEEAARIRGTARARLRHAIDALVQGSEAHREQIRLISREAAFLPPPMRAKVHRRWAGYLGHIRTILADGVAASEFADVDTEVTAHLIEALCEAWSLRRFVMRRHGIEKVAALIQQLVATGLRPAPAPEPQ